ncbi:MAG: DUF1801 domain-containing protein [Cellulomonadaceae bacterium]|nr:DUF1801 domain-containing protein [Cellulomonadaceae bacterium]
MAKTHPHIDQPTDAQLAQVVATKPDAIAHTYLALHRLIVETVPDVKVSVDEHDGAIGYAARQWGYDGWGMGAVVPYSKWVNLQFIDGASLPDPHGLLQGAAKRVRHVKLFSAAEVAKRAPDLQALVKAAAALKV